MADELRIDPETVSWSVPEGEREGRPLAIVLHGHGLDERTPFEWASGLPHDPVIASLRGPLTTTSRGGYGWYSISRVLAGDDGQVDDSALAVLDWLATIAHRPSAVWAMGFSAGGVVATQLLRHPSPRRPDLVVNLGGFAARSLRAPGSLFDPEHPPVLWARGELDDVIPADDIERTHRWFSADPAVRLRSYPGLGHCVSPAMAADVRAFVRERSRSTATRVTRPDPCGRLTGGHQTMRVSNPGQSR